MDLRKAHMRLLLDLTRREFKVRYLGSILGSYWNLIHPLIMILIYTMVFSRVMHNRLGADAGPFSYSIYLCSGLLAWNLLSEIMNRGAVTLLDNAGFLKKLSFPPVILFGASLASAFVNFFISFSIFLVILLIIKPMTPVLFLLYMLTVLLLALFGFGLAVGVGCLNVFTRDFQQMVSVVFQLWFWFTPIVYLTSALPELAKKLLYFNPAFAFIEPLHQLFYFQEVPEAKFWLMMVGWVTLSLAFGAFVYRKLISHVRDHL